MLSARSAACWHHTTHKSATKATERCRLLPFVLDFSRQKNKEPIFLKPRLNLRSSWQNNASARLKSGAADLMCATRTTHWTITSFPEEVVAGPRLCRPACRPFVPSALRHADVRMRMWIRSNSMEKRGGRLVVMSTFLHL